MTNVLIFGGLGQTGAYLTKKYLDNGANVTLTTRKKEKHRLTNLNALDVDIDAINVLEIDPLDSSQVMRCLDEGDVNIIYNMTGQSSVGASFAHPADSISSIVIPCHNILNAISQIRSNARFLNISSTECFGSTSSLRFTEESCHRPLSPYAVGKSAASHLTNIFKHSYGIQGFNIYLSNHESPLRPSQFVTSKITKSLHQIKCGELERLELGSLHVVRDWGWAADFAEALYLIGVCANCDDCLIATGKSYSLRHFVRLLCNEFSLDFEDVVVERSELRRPLELDSSLLDSGKLKKLIRWKPTTNLSQIASKLASSCLF
jgi:GDPmannose 4,6-dehydratase